MNFRDFSNNEMLVLCRLTWGFVKKTIKSTISNLTRSLCSPSPAGDAGRKISRRGSLTGGFCLLLLQLTSVEISWSKTQVDYFKLYAHTRIVDFKEFKCLEKLWTKESNWRKEAFNKSGGAYGIPQLKNKKLKNMDGFTQIDWGLKYIKHRHQTPCQAWAYWLQFKHY